MLAAKANWINYLMAVTFSSSYSLDNLPSIFLSKNLAGGRFLFVAPNFIYLFKKPAAIFLVHQIKCKQESSINVACMHEHVACSSDKSTRAAVQYLVFTGILQGTESRMQELVPGSAGSTMTKGLSSKVTTRRCCASSKGFRKEP